MPFNASDKQLSALYWVINTSNGIIRAHCVADDDGKPLQPMKTGHVTISAILAMASRIAHFQQATPSIIFRLLKSVIRIRTSFYEQYRSFQTSQQDPDLERSNASHKAIIDALSTPLEEVQNLETMFGNMFSALSSGPTTAGGDSDHESEEASSTHISAQRRVRKKGKKVRKPAKGKQGTRHHTSGTPKAGSSDCVSLNDCDIVGDEEDPFGSYSMATHALAEEWASLRTYIQDIWHEVAYHGFNSVVAAAQSKVAVSMIQQAQLAIFAEFPNRDGYANVLRTFRTESKDNPRSEECDWYPVFLVATLYGLNKEHLGRESGLVDVAEQSMVFAYYDLLDFITDYRKNRNGKPTKALQTGIHDWDPNLDLLQATKAQRLAWRRQYTIIWLYDLVNLYTYPVFKIRASTGGLLALEDTDWSPGGVCGKQRSLVGLKDFASFVTGLAMQKPGTPHESKILPHHVFQLQCVVDSFTVSRGWSIHHLKSHVLEQPAFFYSPTEEIRAFVYGDTASHRPGYIQGASTLKQILREQHKASRGFDNYHFANEVIKSLESELSQWLPPSNSQKPPAFASQLPATGCKGLLQHSPWLCGDSLIQGLNLAFRTAMIIWESIPEPMMLTLLHNMLVEEGLLEEIEILGKMKFYFPDSIQLDGSPVSDPFSKWMKSLTTFPGNRSRSQAPSLRGLRGRASTDNPGSRLCSSTKSQLLVCDEAEWNLHRVPDYALRPLGNLWRLRFSQTPVHVDSVTGKEKLQSTQIVCRLRDLQFPEYCIPDLFEQAKEFAKEIVASRAKPPSHSGNLEGEFLQNVRLDVHSSPQTKATDPRTLSLADVPRTDMVNLFQADIYQDVCGEVPLSGLDYLSLTAQFMSVFSDIEKRLGTMKHPLYTHIYNHDSGLFKSERVGLTWSALFGGSQDCWRGIADSLRASNLSVSNHSIWEDLDTDSKKLSEAHERTAKHDKCSVM
ncbi:hypothetical protein CcaCcLH18_03407 [Colletotrichum camelliae]|nr:hypothetical protein CcaCcLH18_03407 [Colletotrichum camelliae]